MKNKHYGKKINIISNKIKWGFNQLAENYGVTGVQTRILLFIVEKSKVGEIFQKDVEKDFNLSRSTVTGVLQLLEEKELIIRTVSKEDARLKKIEVTDEGFRVQRKLKVALLEYEVNLVKGISEEKLKILVEVLGSIEENIENMEDKW